MCLPCQMNADELRKGPSAQNGTFEVQNDLFSTDCLWFGYLEFSAILVTTHNSVIWLENKDELL